MEPTGPIAATAAGALTATAKDSGSGFLRTVLRVPGEALGGLFGDFIHERRHANLINIAKRATQRLKDAGVSAKEVPLSIIHPALEAASLEEDPELQEVWANLLANAADERSIRLVHPAFSGILRQLSSADARYANALFEAALQMIREQNWRYKTVAAVRFSDGQMDEAFENAGLAERPKWRNDMSEQEQKAYLAAKDSDDGKESVCITSLIRHQLITDNVDMSVEERYQKGSAYGVSYSVPRDKYDLKFTYGFSTFGVKFMDACRPPLPKENS